MVEIQCSSKMSSFDNRSNRVDEFEDALRGIESHEALVNLLEGNEDYYFEFQDDFVHFHLDKTTSPYAKYLSDDDRFIAALFISEDDSLRNCLPMVSLATTIIKLRDKIIKRNVRAKSMSTNVHKYRKTQIFADSVVDMFMQFIEFIYQYIIDLPIEAIHESLLYNFIVELNIPDIDTTNRYKSSTVFINYIIRRMNFFISKFKFVGIPYIRAIPTVDHTFDKIEQTDLALIKPRTSYKHSNALFNKAKRESIFNVIYSIIIYWANKFYGNIARRITLPENVQPSAPLGTTNVRSKQKRTLNIYNFNHLTLPANASAIPRQNLPPSYTNESGNRVNKDPSQIKEDDLLCYIDDPDKRLDGSNEGNNYFITTYSNYQRIKSLDGGNMVKLIGIAKPLRIDPTEEIIFSTESNMLPHSVDLYVYEPDRRKVKMYSSVYKNGNKREKMVPNKHISTSLPFSVRESVVHGIIPSLKDDPNSPEGKGKIKITFKLSTYINTNKKLGELGKSPFFQMIRYNRITPEQTERLKDVTFVYTTEVNGVEYYLIQNYQSDQFILWMNYNGYLVETPCIFVPPNELSNRPLENLFPAASPSASASAPSNRRNRGNGGSAGAGGTP